MRQDISVYNILHLKNAIVIVAENYSVLWNLLWHYCYAYAWPWMSQFGNSTKPAVSIRKMPCLQYFLLQPWKTDYFCCYLVILWSQLNVFQFLEYLTLEFVKLVCILKIATISVKKGILILEHYMVYSKYNLSLRLISTVSAQRITNDQQTPKKQKPFEKSNKNHWHPRCNQPATKNFNA